jgi:4-amino-4-deoxy-L-arabinose transferase-like glycosyltransferase
MMAWWRRGREGRRTAAIVLLLAGAALAYSWGLGRQPLGASEAYSAHVAAQSSPVLVARSALALDPGKPVLYHLLLHWFGALFGLSEAALRVPSVIFGVVSAYLVFALGERWFGVEVGMAAAALWTFNPVAAVIARWARMYSMFVAATLAHLLAMARVRDGAGRAAVLIAGITGGAMLYVHLGGMLILGADVAVSVREWRRGGRCRSWPAVAIAALLFLPFVPLMAAQTRALLFGHWLDWLGARRSTPAAMLLGAMVAGLAAWWLTLAPAGSERRERLQQCLLYALGPILALAACSILIRPVFEIRYVSPSLAVLAVVLGYGLDRGGARLRNLGTVAMAGLSIALLPLCYGAPRDPWPAIAAAVAVAAPAEPIFFEAGFFSPDAVGTDGGFPDGFFRVPFDYYFHRGNPRAVIPGGQPATAQKIIEAAVRQHGGAWLVSAQSWPAAQAELPSGSNLRLAFCARFSRISVFHLEWIGRP